MSSLVTRRFRFAAALLSTLACLAGFSLPAEAVRLTGKIDTQSTGDSSAQI